MRLTMQYHLLKINDAVGSDDIFERELLKCSGLIEGKGDDTTKILKFEFYVVMCYSVASNSKWKIF